MADYSKAYGSLNTKKDAEWYTDELGGKFLIASLNNPTFRVASMKQIKSVETEDENQTIYSINEPYIKLVAEYILLDWQNVSFEGNDGKTIDKYSVEAATTLLLNYEPVAQFVVEKATELQEQKEKVLAGNKKK